VPTSPAWTGLLVGVAGGFAAVKIFHSSLVDARVQAGMGEAAAGWSSARRADSQ